MYPVRYEADYAERHDRWRTGFRFILIIPWYVVQQIYSYAILVTAFVAWLVLVITAKYPAGLYDFNAGYLRFNARVTAFFFLQTDAWPSFGFDQAGYPIRLEISDPPKRFSRWKAGFRLILAIPAAVVAALMFFLASCAAIISWLTIVFTGRQPKGIHNVLALAIGYIMRANAYAYLLLTEAYPPVSDQEVAPGASPSPRQ